MAPSTVLHFKKDCISCGACAAITPEFWEMDEAGLAHLKGSTLAGDHWERDIKTEEDCAQHLEAANCCPVNIIKIEKKT